MPKDKKEIKIRDWPDMGRPGLKPGAKGPASHLAIAPANKTQKKEYTCTNCAQNITKGEVRKVVTVYCQPWITDEMVVMSSGARCLTFSLCGNPACQNYLLEKVGHEKKASIREFAQYASKLAYERGDLDKEWEWNYHKSRVEKFFESEEEALLRTLNFVAHEMDIPAAHRDKFFSNHGYSKQDRLKMKKNTYPFPWIKKEEYSDQQISILAADEDFKARFFAELAKTTK